VSENKSKIICGLTLSQKIYGQVTEKITDFKKCFDINPCLAVIMVGDNSSSKIYVKNKQIACQKVGIESKIYDLDENVTKNELLDLIGQLNQDKNIHGILLQLPLPNHIQYNDILKAINPIKDVDGLHPENLGLLISNRPRIIPCTPQGCLQMINSVHPNIDGKKVVVLGRSILVGKSLAILLINQNASVTVLHSLSKNIQQTCSQADILVVAIGKKYFIDDSFIKKGATVIDVGITKGDDSKIYGDVDFEKVIEKVNFISPVPKGVGPMTIANLLLNLTNCLKLQFSKF
jgi:methylenetetrahydrofolate dehydrogenase (NADP+) / methenyltetrahydrofolate cyclohydrolase